MINRLVERFLGLFRGAFSRRVSYDAQRVVNQTSFDGTSVDRYKKLVKEYTGVFISLDRVGKTSSRHIQYIR